MISKNKLKLIKALATKKGRERSGLFLAEGPKIVDELIAGGFELEFLIDNPDEVCQASLLQHPQGVIGVFKQKVQPESETPLGQTLTIALDCVQDPGNLGTIIRIADWFGIRNIICSIDTADCWNPKVVQATMGSIARVAIRYANLESELTSISTDTPVYGTVLDGTSLYDEKSLADRGIIVMGNEGNGISPSIRRLLTHRLVIPPFAKYGPTAESLNVAVATAIVCAEFRRRTT